MTQRCDQYENLPELQERLTGAMGQMIREGQWEKVGQLSDLLTKLEKNPGDVKCDDIKEFLTESASSDANAAEPEEAHQPEPSSPKTPEPPSSPPEEPEEEAPPDDASDDTQEGKKDEDIARFDDSAPAEAAISDVPENTNAEKEKVWRALRDLRSEPPHNVEELRDYLATFDHIQQRLGDDLLLRPEGVRAQGEMDILASAWKQYANARELLAQADAVLKDKDVEGCGSMLQDLRGVLEYLESFRELREQFPDLYGNLMGKGLRDEVVRIGEAREALAQNLRQVTTRAETKKAEELLALLQDVNAMTAPSIPVDPNSEVYGAIHMWQSDVGMMARRADVARAVRNKLLQVSIESAARLLAEGKGFLERENLSLSRAQDRYEKAKYFGKIPEITNAPEMGEIHRGLEDLLEQIEVWEKRKDDAARLLEEARETLSKTELSQEQIIEALRKLQEADSYFPALPTLPEQIENAARIWNIYLDRQLGEVERQSKKLAEEREYDDAINEVEAFEQKALSPALQGLAEFAGIDFTPYLQNAQSLNDTLDEEQKAWEQFQEKRKKILGWERPPIVNNDLDEEFLRDFIDLDKHYLDEAFQKEWEALTGDLSARVGAVALYQRALESFKMNPANPQIWDWLKKIDDPEYAESAAQLASRHRAHALFEKAEEVFQGGDSCQQALQGQTWVTCGDKSCTIGADEWRSCIEKFLGQARQEADGWHDDASFRAVDSALKEKVTNLANAVGSLVNLCKEVDSSLQEQSFAQAWRLLASATEEVGLVENPFWRQGIRILQEEVKSLWGVHVEKFLKDKVFEDLKSLKIRSNITTENVEKAHKLLQEPTEAGVRIFDMQALATERIDYLQVEMKLGSLLSDRGKIIPVWEKNGPELLRLLWASSQAGMSPAKWQPLFELLDDLQKRPEVVGSSLNRDLAYKLWFLSLIAFGLTDTSGEAVTRIQEARKRTDALWRKPILCGLLAMHYLRDLSWNENASAVPSDIAQLIRELESNRALAQLADTVRAMKGARSTWLHDHYERARDKLVLAMERLAELEMGTQEEDEVVQDIFAQAMRQAGYYLLKDWQHTTCQNKKQKFHESSKTSKGGGECQNENALGVFDLLQKGYTALRICCPAQYGEIGASTEQTQRRQPSHFENAAAGDDGAVYTLGLGGSLDWDCDEDVRIEQDVENLKKKAVDCYYLLNSQIDVLLNDPVRDLKKAVREGQVLLEKLEVIDQMEETGRGRGQLTRLKENIQTLGKLVELWESTSGLLGSMKWQLENLFKQDWPWTIEFDENPLLQLAGMEEKLRTKKEDFADAIPEEMKDMLDFVTALKENCESIGEFYAAILSKFYDDEGLARANDFKQLLSYIDEFEKLLAEVKRDSNDFKLDWDKHFKLIEERRGRDGLLEKRTITSPDELREVIDEQKSNWEAWQKWTSDVQKDLEDLKSQEQVIRQNLRNGFLSRAKQDWKENLMGKIEDVEKRKSAMPAPPLTPAALKEAQRTADYTPVAELNDAWNRIQKASKYDITREWGTFLQKEIERSRKQYMAFDSEIKGKEDALNGIIEKMRKYTQQRARAAERGRLTQQNLKTLERYLDEAQAIDKEDFRVKNYAKRYRIWQNSVRK